MKFYASVPAYPSVFEPTKIFATVAEARAFDRGWVVNFIALASSDHVNRAIAGENAEGWRAVLLYLIDELPFMNKVGNETPSDSERVIALHAADEG